jgi:hypothetical protein
MEGYFVRTLGMHRVYNSAFMNMLKMEENEKFRQTVANVLEFSPAILQRFVNFMNNPDEKTAVEQFGRDDKYFGCAMMLVTMPGLPMLGHGQIEGFSEKYGMEYRKAYWDEQIDEGMVARHQREVFPLMRHRHLFSGAENFALFDFRTDGGWTDENVFAYTNRHGDERALILFNNSYESTSGRVHLSTPINVGSGDEPRHENRSLARALGLETGDGVWYRIRDHIDGLEYLRSASELADWGFHSDLRGYQFRALIDFRVVHDQDGIWARVAASLQGGGNPDLDRLVGRIRREPVLARIRPWITPEVFADLEPGTDDEAVLPDDLPASVATIMAGLNDLQDLRLPPRAGKGLDSELEELMAGLPGSRIPQALYLGAILAAWADHVPGAEESDLDLLVEDAETALREWTGHQHAARSGAVLALILAGASPYLADLRLGRTGWFPKLAATGEGREILGINQHEGRTWINREGLELLMDALAVATLPGTEDDALVAVFDARGLILESAQTAGYELDRLLKILGSS